MTSDKRTANIRMEQEAFLSSAHLSMTPSISNATQEQRNGSDIRGLIFFPRELTTENLMEEEINHTISRESLRLIIGWVTALAEVGGMFIHLEPFCYK